jgi:hypothetical protein
MRIGEDTTTWATLPEECYTPTPQKPWQGIWCGDYAGHGCEFLALIQPDDPKPLPEKAERALRAREREGSISSEDSWETAPTDVGSDAHMSNTTDGTEDTVPVPQGAPREEGGFSDPDCAAEQEIVYRGRIEAIKLTGDPNIPRGEYTFIAPDIGPEGYLRTATDDIFRGARIVKSVGHIAAHGFRDGERDQLQFVRDLRLTLADDYMASELILISPDRLAQYWETFGHVSFYQRVNIDEFTKVP